MGPSNRSYFAAPEGSVNDSHRFALLLAQFYGDKQTKSLPASIINVLCRNRQVSLRMPKFKDTRKSTQTNQFNGWVDETEPRSPLAELFGKIVPAMVNLKRKGVFHFPPPPPHEELPSLPPSYKIQADSVASLQKKFPHVFFDRPELTDFGCEEKCFATLDVAAIAQLAVSCHHRIGTDVLKAEPPTRIEDSGHFAKVCATCIKQNNYVTDVYINKEKT